MWYVIHTALEDESVQRNGLVGIFTGKKYSSDKQAWEAACRTYHRPKLPTNNDDSIDDDGSDHGDLNDDTTDESLYRLHIKTLEDALSKAIFMMENTKKDLASEKKDKCQKRRTSCGVLIH